MRFKPSVWVRAGRLQILSISNVKEAQALLKRWPEKARRDGYSDVHDILARTVEGMVTPEDARKCLVTFLEGANMLAECRLAE